MLKKGFLVIYPIIAFVLIGLFLITFGKNVFAQSQGQFGCEWFPGFGCQPSTIINSCAAGFESDKSQCASNSQSECNSQIYTCVSNLPPATEYCYACNPSDAAICTPSTTNCEYKGSTPEEAQSSCLASCTGQAPISDTELDPTNSSTSNNSTEPVPKPRVPCGTQADPEFHSLRPYQASPCGGYVEARFCSNDLIFTESFELKNKGGCRPRGVEGTFTCNPDFKVDPHDLFVDLDNSMFPIMGNTEQVTNSQGGTEEFDDATKLNEYVSWYLHGVNSKAEYGGTKNTANELVNFSGPIQKLMPGAFQDLQRIATIQSVTQEGASDPESDDANAPASEPQNHNQIVVCESFGRPVECPKGTPHRLREWDDGSLSPYNTFINWFGANAWDKRVPPLPWQFEKDIYYQKAYMEWRGKSCSILFGKLICIENLLVPNMWANLFTYVPLANTVDKKGVEYIVTINFLPSGETEITGEDTGVTKNAPLYFAHTQEDKELSEFLNSSYTPKDFSSVPLPETTEKNECSALNVRSNPGDNLFPGTPHGFEIPDVTYKIIQVECTETIEEVCGERNGVEVCRNVHQLTCPAEVVIEIPTKTKTPWAEDIWKTTVADSGSTFRKIFPKVETGAPVTCIADIPTVTNVDYDAEKSQKPQGGDLTFKVGRKPEDAAGDTPQLTFPHIGSIYEYFLKGIQTALRPQGYGEPITDGIYCGGVACGELPELPKSSGSCSLGGISSSVGNIPQSLKDIIEAAAQTYQVPPNLILGIMYGEGLFDGGNAKDWTDENVKNWATCVPVPDCSTSGDDGFLGFFDSGWQNIIPNIENDLKELDPNRETPSQCNLLDAIYGLAWDLHNNAGGGGSIPIDRCFGINLSAPIPSSCNWTDEQYESAIKVAGSGYTDQCLTLEGSCLTGGGLNAACPNGDSCETVGNYNPSNPSHNACVWNVAHGR